MADVVVNRKFDKGDVSRPIVWTANVCPFAERVIIALQEMGIDFDAVEVDLLNKPASLFEVNSKGLVPVMKDQNNCITDSYNILQYIDDMWARSDKKTLMPVKPADRAVARHWCDFIGNTVVRLFMEILMKQIKEEQEAAKAKLLDSLRVLNDAMKSISEDGPFFMGADFSIVDIMLATKVERFPALKLYREFVVPKTEEFCRFNSWWKAVNAHPSFQPGKISEELMGEVYKKFADNTTTSKAAQAIRKGEAIP
eukprot:gene8506-9418_t